MAFDWKNIVKTVAPTIATALGGPAAGLGIKALSQVFLGKDDGSQEEIEQAVQNATPQQLLELKKADQNFKIEMKKLDIDLERLAYEDKASARAREIAVKDKTPAILAYGITIGFFGLLTALILVSIPEANKAIIYTMTGVLGTVWIAAMAYYHGSSRGSQRKDELRLLGK